MDCAPSDAAVHPGAVEVCDGVDDDCDSATADGVGDPLVGAACDGADTDLCAEGTWSCAGGQLACSDITGGQVEACDGVDNDCDGAIDDGFPQNVLHGSLGCTSGEIVLTCDPSWFDCDGDLLGGCENDGPCPVGQACTSDADCPSGLCADEAVNGFPSGMCTADCNADPSACPADAECVGVCFPACTSDADCRDGYSCFDGQAGRPICYPDCVVNTQCPTVGVCNPYLGLCAPLRGAGLDGAACSGDADCESDYCEPSLPEGYCTSFCSLAGNTCGGDGVCAEVLYGYSLMGACLDGCVSDAQCRVDYTCTHFTQGNACWP